MRQPTLCMIFEAIGPYNAIGKIAAAEVRAALATGYRVTVVAHRLDESLLGEVEWLKLYNPPRGFALKWLTARHFIKRALGGRRFDVVHGHQPQVADLCDVFQCHFLTRVANERDCLVAGHGLTAHIRKWQQQIVMRAEDRYYRRWNPATQMLFVSELLRREFGRLYGLPAQHAVLENAAPPVNMPSEQERLAARAYYGVAEERRPVVGYIGGLQRRKGYVELLDALADEAGLFLLMGGQHTAGFRDVRLQGRMNAVGMAGDVSRFYAACDVLVVPSRFDPCPLVVLEAVSRGLPVITTEGVGNEATVLAFGAGVSWRPSSSLGELVGHITAGRSRFVAGCEALCRERSQSRQLEAILSRYDKVMTDKVRLSATNPVATPAVGMS
jgi:glycosyltransferase involved in cell wall biosynthesis